MQSGHSNQTNAVFIASHHKVKVTGVKAAGNIENFCRRERENLYISLEKQFLIKTLKDVDTKS